MMEKLPWYKRAMSFARGWMEEELSRPYIPYQWKPIDGLNEIRLLRILPAKSDHASIWCHMEHHIRLECPPYEALSYTWGDNSLCKSIFCDNSRLPIPAKCEAALRALRRNRNSPSSLFWIDAICIDQANTKERNSQVSIMGQIFSRSESTLCFLGDFSFEGRSRRTTHVCQKDKVKVDFELWQDGQSHCAFFERTRIIQEALLSRVKLVLTTDDVRDWSVFYRPRSLPVIFLNTTNLLSRYGPKDLPKMGRYGLDLISPDMSLALWWLVEIMDKTRNFQCQDARDKLFGILPLFQQPIPELLKVDYSKSVREVYFDLTWFAIDYDIPRVLSLAGLKQAGDEFPSWVVDWRVKSSVPSVDHCDSCQAGFINGQKRLIAKRNNDILTVRGRLVDRIISSQTSPPLGDDADGFFLVRRCVKPRTSTNEHAQIN